MIWKHTFFFRKRFNSSFPIFVDFLSFSEQSDETIDNKTEQLSLQYGKDESTGAVKVHADENQFQNNVVSRQMMRLRRKLKFYCWATRITILLLFLLLTIFVIMISWLLCCQAQRDTAMQQLSEAYLQLKRWAELLELTIHRLGPNLENEGFESSLLSPN